MFTLSTGALGVAALCFGLGACAKNGKTTAADTATAPGDVAVAVAPGGPVTLTVAARPGEAVYLTDAAGRAVYYIAGPDGAAVECTGECATEFDPVTGKAVVATGDTTVKLALIAEAPGPNGAAQVTYNGKPLYYHRGDQPGDTKGQGMKAGNGEASLVTPNGDKVRK